MRLPVLPVAAAIATTALASAQLVSQEPPLVPAQAGPGLGFGYDLALRGDELYVGAPNDLAKSPLLGAIYRFQLGPAGWAEVETLRPAGSYLGDRFGTALAVDADTLVGAAWSVPTGTEIVVFERQGAAWVETARIAVPSTTTSQRPNLAVRGGAIAVGIPGHSNGRGRAVVYERTGTDWSRHTETILPTLGNQLNDQFGSDVDFDATGLRLVVGVARDEPAGVSLGEDWGSIALFERGPTQFDLVETIEAPVPELDGFFGQAVVLDDGRLFGGRPASQSSGAVDVLREIGGVWQLEQSILPSNPPGFLRFGEALAHSEGRLAVGAPLDGVAGAVHLYTLEDGAYVFRERLVPANEISNSDFGQALAVGEGRVLAGAPGSGDQFVLSGVVHSFVVDVPPPVTYCTAKATTDGCLPAIATSGTATLTGADDFVVDCVDAAPGKTGLFFYGTNGPVAVPFFNGTLCVMPPLQRTPPQAAGGAGTCGGVYGYSFAQATLELEGVAPGDLVHGQWWLRDPQHPDGTGVALSNATQITVGL